MMFVVAIDALYYGPGWYPCHYVKAFPQPVTHILRYQTTTLDFTSANGFKNNKLIINTSIGLLGKKNQKLHNQCSQLAQKRPVIIVG